MSGPLSCPLTAAPRSQQRSSWLDTVLIFLPMELLAGTPRAAELPLPTLRASLCLLPQGFPQLFPLFHFCCALLGKVSHWKLPKNLIRLTIDGAVLVYWYSQWTRFSSQAASWATEPSHVPFRLDTFRSGHDLGPISCCWVVQPWSPRHGGAILRSYL